MTTGFCKQLCGFYHWADLFDMSIRAVAFDGLPTMPKTGHEKEVPSSGGAFGFNIPGLDGLDNWYF